MCIQVKQKDNNILSYLYSHEQYFVEEIDKFNDSLFIGKENDGWFFIPACGDCSDWAVLRLIGKAKNSISMLFDAVNIAKEHCNTNSLRIIVPECVKNEFEDYFFQFKKTNSLFLYVSSDINKQISLKNNCEISITDKYSVLSLSKENIGFILFNYCSKHYADIFIQIEHENRGKGFGKALLFNTAKLVENKGIKLVYWVEENNFISIKTAKSAGFNLLEKFNVFTL